MAVKFEGDLNTLIRDLETRGYRVRKAETIAGAAGRTADVFLDNGAVVQWDAYSQRVWADGPITESQRTETYLRCLYEGGILGRFWVSSLWNLSQSVGFVRSKFIQVKRATEKTSKPQLSPAKASTENPPAGSAVSLVTWRFLCSKIFLPGSSRTGELPDLRVTSTSLKTPTAAR